MPAQTRCGRITAKLALSHALSVVEGEDEGTPRTPRILRSRDSVTLSLSKGIPVEAIQYSVIQLQIVHFFNDVEGMHA